MGPENEFPVNAEESGISPGELDISISEICKKPEYAWKRPREKREDSSDSAIISFLKNIYRAIGEQIRRIARSVGNFFKKIRDWIDRLFGGVQSSRSSGVDWVSMLRWLLIVFLGVLTAILGVIMYRMLKQRQKRRIVPESEPVARKIDLEDEEVGADLLPEQGWMLLAREMIEQGEYRLALRAIYLASLAYLAHHEMITIARFKTDRDYEKELNKRFHADTELLELFGENVSVFEQVWYGMYTVSKEILDNFSLNRDRLKICVEK
jgi:hypothetical protein